MNGTPQPNQKWLPALGIEPRSFRHKPQPLPFLNLQNYNIMYIHPVADISSLGFIILWVWYYTDMTQKYICCSYTVFLIPIHVHRYLYQSFVSCMIIKSHLKSHYELVRRVWELSPEYTCGGNFDHALQTSARRSKDICHCWCSHCQANKWIWEIQSFVFLSIQM